MADLRHLLAIYVHARQAGNSVPPHIDADARAALAAEPPAPGPTINDIWELCEDHEFHLGEGFDDEASAEIMLQIIRVALSRWGNQPPAPAPASGGEREELAALINQIALAWEPDACLLGNMTASQLARAATLLREPAPAPVPGWQPISTAPQDGTEILASDYDAIEIVSWDCEPEEPAWRDRDGLRMYPGMYPAWWQPIPDHPPIPQPPQGEEVEE